MANKTEYNDWSSVEVNRGYKVVDPTHLYCGKGYADWVCDWFNWFFSANPDSHNSGPVVFLKSFPTPASNLGTFEDHGMSAETSEVQNTPTSNYMNEPNIMVAGDGLQIFEDQAVLLPVINSFWIATEPYADLGYMRGYTGPNTDHCDIDPEKITIDFNPIELPAGKGITRDFRIITSVFTAIIPESGYGVSLKDYIGIPMPPGPYPAIVEGFFILLKFMPRKDAFRIQSLARAPDDHTGHYFADLLYEISVSDRPVKGPSYIARLPQNEALIKRKLNEKVRHGEITEVQSTSIFSKKAPNKPISGKTNRKKLD